MEEIRDQVHATIQGRRRFYDTVAITPTPPAHYHILLDQHVLRSPGRRPLEFTSAPLAQAVADEWDAQGLEHGIQPSSMPLMGLASTAIDQIEVKPEIQS